MMLAPSHDSMKLYNRLYRATIAKFRCAADLAEDAVSDAICAALGNGQLSYAYCAASVRNYIFEYWRNRAARNEGYALPTNEDGEAIEPIVGAMPAHQHLRIEAIECVNAIERLPESVRQTMRLVARDFSADEIAERLGLPKSDVQWRIKYARKILRDRDGYEIERKRGHHEYIGIRKRHRLWEASIRQGEEYYYLGHFKTAAEAARAYDRKARELFGFKAKVNFDEE